MLLDKIKGPQDVRSLEIKKLGKLADEVRERIIEVTSKTGGHLSPSLGAADIAVAILKVFDPLINRIVWDVGHQSYAYKILTGRNEQFTTLRQYGGLSGFNNIFESEFDAFGVGHSSTSVSAALGMAAAESIKGNKEKMIAIIGDGALTGGMSFEALNHSGHLQKELLVILNDNTMSISKNVGALQNYLSGMLVSKSYNSLKKQIWELSETHLPKKIRSTFLYGAKKIEESVLNILIPNIIFEDLGFKYVGPIDGHNIPRMVKILNNVKNNMIGPVFVHVITQKGKGCTFAERDCTKYHGLGPYSEKTGKVKSKSTVTYSKYFGDTLCSLAEKNEKIVAITAAMSEGTGLCQFEKKFPERFFDVGIAEQHSVTFAGGLALRGFKPFIAIYSTFMQRALDQIIHDIALQKIPVVFCLDRAGLVGEDGATHHGAFDLSYLNFIPDLIVMAPACREDFKMMLTFAAEYQKGPIAIRYPRGEVVSRGGEIAPLELGKYEVVTPFDQENSTNKKRITLLGIGSGFNLAAEICEDLKLKGADIMLINARFLKPMDIETLTTAAEKSDLVVTIEENSLSGGFGSNVSTFMSRYKVPVYSYGIPDKFIPHGNTQILKESIKLTKEDLLSSLGQTLKD